MDDDDDTVAGPAPDWSPQTFRARTGSMATYIARQMSIEPAGKCNWVRPRLTSLELKPNESPSLSLYITRSLAPPAVKCSRQSFDGQDRHEEVSPDTHFAQIINSPRRRDKLAFSRFSADIKTQLYGTLEDHQPVTRRRKCVSLRSAVRFVLKSEPRVSLHEGTVV